MNKSLFSAVLLAVAGCTTPPKQGGPWDASQKEVVEIQAERACITGRGVMSPYGVWIGKGPKILASDGSPLTNARVVFGNDPMAEGLPVDESGCVTVNRYVLNGYFRGYRRDRGESGNLTVLCPGYHSVVNRSLFDHQGVIKEIRLTPILAQPPCRSFSSEAMILCGKDNGRRSFDFVEGDWLPPYGWGKVEDIRITVSTNLSPLIASYSVSYNGVKRVSSRDNQQVVRVEFVRDGDGFGKDEENFSDCTNRVIYCKQYDRDIRGVFKVRGFYGSIDSSEIRRENRCYYVEEGDGKSVRRDGPDAYLIKFDGRVNTVKDLKGLESAAAPVPPRPPVFHPAPKDLNLMAFGLAENGRAAVCFGWTKDGAVVPEIFWKGVYTSDPAKDISEVETLYFDPCASYPEVSPMINGLKNLRSVVLVGNNTTVRTIGNRAFADNPELNAVIFDGYRPETTVAADTFSGAAADLTAVYSDNSYNCNRPWDSVAVSNVFSRMVKVYTASRSDDWMIAPPEVDFTLGKVELPVIRLGDGYLDKEYSDGRILRYRKDGFAEKIFK